ncbi:precorrin-2 dehydrogenase [Fervidicella metallireducens AeB]|uniref:precorrin-2 dehydrogenase n=1 Tax=Fervidicella metallireducens AeB TaxID=1403537 RepID=A0A017RWS9_9CLOT|nr:NAD(P)-dependent oxidoreductase [Fervidicella metallireducens]EYE89233.1 precorrin-2 dehydrogenase [Fervidicella metallireducens AeB]
MPKNIKQDIYDGTIDYMFISLISSKTKILIVGGGRAGYIKAQSFLRKGCSITVISREFIEDFKELESINLKLIKREYSNSYIKNHHLIVIATDDDKLNDAIKRDCDENFKLYLTCNDYRKGMFVVPTMGETKTTQIALHTKKGSPKTSIYLCNKINSSLKENDDFIDYVSSFRNKIKKFDNRLELLDFINTDDFLYFFKKGKHEVVLKMFYGGFIIET